MQYISKIEWWIAALLPFQIFTISIFGKYSFALIFFFSFIFFIKNFLISRFNGLIPYLVFIAAIFLSIIISKSIVQSLVNTSALILATSILAYFDFRREDFIAYHKGTLFSFLIISFALIIEILGQIFFGKTFHGFFHKIFILFPDGGSINLFNTFHNCSNYIDLSTNLFCRPYGFSSEPSYLSIYFVTAAIYFYKIKLFKYSIVSSIAVFLVNSTIGIIIFVIFLLHVIFENIRSKNFSANDVMKIFIALGFFLLFIFLTIDLDLMIWKINAAFNNLTLALTNDIPAARFEYLFVLKKFFLDASLSEIFFGLSNVSQFTQNYSYNALPILNTFADMILQFGVIGFLTLLYFLTTFSRDALKYNRLLFLLTVIILLSFSSIIYQYYIWHIIFFYVVLFNVKPEYVN